MFALACAASMSLPAMADGWTAPTPKGSELVSKNSYYLYNTGAGQFLVNGNDWGTHASIGDAGVEVFMNDSVGTDIQHTGWTLWTETLVGSTKHGFTFIDEALGAYMDMGKQGHNFWKITKNDDGTYRIKIIDDDDAYGIAAGEGLYANSYLGWVGTRDEEGAISDTHVMPLLDPTQEGRENVALDWMFVSAEDYASYASRKALYTQLIRAEEHPTVSTDEAGAVYNNPNATEEEIAAATATLKAAIDADIYGSASEDNPLDVTEVFITNPNCGSSEGWTGAVQDGSQKPNYFAFQGATYTNDNDGTTISSFLENWTGGGGQLPDKAMYQALSGLPMGKYTLEADVIAVQQNNADMETVGAYLFADGGIMSRVSCNTGNGVPEHVSLDFVVIRDSVSIGFMTESTNANWVCVDNFKLTFYGKDANAVKNSLAVKISEANDVQYMEGVTIYGQQTEEALNAALAKAAGVYNGGTDDEARDMIAELDVVIATVKAEITAYERLYKLYDEFAPESVTKYDEAGFPVVVEAIEGLMDTWETAYWDRTYTTADVDSAYATLDKVIVDGIHETLKGPDGAGKEITGLLVNANFDNGTSGWVNSDNTGVMAVSYSCAEYFNKLFDISQTLTNLPNGRYTIKAQAFYRSTTHDEAYDAWNSGVEDVRLFLYGNDTEKACKSIFDDAQPELIYDSGDWQSDKENASGTFVPNSMAGSHLYFERGLYDNEVSCVVTDGTLKIGMRCYGNVISGDYWSLFDNFRVYYSGNTTADYQEAIEDLCARAGAKQDEGIRVAEANTKLDAAVEQGMTALDETPEACLAAIEELKAAIAYAETSIKLVDEALVQADNISVKSMDVVSSYTGLQILIDEITLKGNGDFGGAPFATNEEVIALTKRLKTELSTFVLYDYVNTATEEDPCDATILVECASFVNDANENAADGWTGGGTANYGAYEIFNKAYDFNQTIYGLTPGYYKVSVQGFYRFGGHNSTPGATARRDSIANGKESEPLYANLYATAGETTWSTPLMSIFAGAATESVTGTGEENMASILGGDLGVWCPNTMSAASDYFSFDYYKGNEISFEVAEGVDSVVIGLKKDSLVTNDWTMFDNFELFYVGKSAPTAVEGVAADKVSTAQVIDTKYFTVNGVQVARPVKGIYIKKEVLSDGKINVTKVLVK